MEENQNSEFEKLSASAWFGLAQGFVSAAAREKVLPMRFQPSFDVCVHSPECDYQVRVDVMACFKAPSPSLYPEIITLQIENGINFAKTSARLEWESHGGFSKARVVAAQYFPNAEIGLHNIFDMVAIVNEIGGRLEQPSEYE